MMASGFLFCDFAYIFDYYSILIVKWQNGLINGTEVNRHRTLLSAQITDELFNKIESSQEFAELLKANKETFAMVDMAKKDLCKASDVDVCNTNRFLAKRKLQNKFFNSELTETKRI